jgi:hypothetical protein
VDSLWFLVGCVGFAWLVLWSLRDFDRPSRWFWPFDARWMRPVDRAANGVNADAPGQGGTEPAIAWDRRPSARWRGQP